MHWHEIRIFSMKILLYLPFFVMWILFIVTNNQIQNYFHMHQLHIVELDYKIYSNGNYYRHDDHK